MCEGERDGERGGRSFGWFSATSKNIRFTAHKNTCVRATVCVYAFVFVSAFVFKYILISIYCFCRRLAPPFDGLNT